MGLTKAFSARHSGGDEHRYVYILVYTKKYLCRQKVSLACVQEASLLFSKSCSLGQWWVMLDAIYEQSGLDVILFIADATALFARSSRETVAGQTLNNRILRLSGVLVIQIWKRCIDLAIRRLYKGKATIQHL